MHLMSVSLKIQHQVCTWLQRAMTASGAPLTYRVSWLFRRHLTLIIFLSLLNSSWLTCKRSGSPSSLNQMLLYSLSLLPACFAK